jgi:hypothetical protein
LSPTLLGPVTKRGEVDEVFVVTTRLEVKRPLFFRFSLFREPKSLEITMQEVRLVHRSLGVEDENVF